MLVEGLLGDDWLLAGGLLVVDLVVEGAGGTGWPAAPLVLRDLLLPPLTLGSLLGDDDLLGDDSLLRDGLFVDELVGEGAGGTSGAATLPVSRDLPEAALTGLEIICSTSFLKRNMSSASSSDISLASDVGFLADGLVGIGLP